MNDKVKQILIENKEYLQLNKVEVSREEACVSDADLDKLKPGYTNAIDASDYSKRYYYRFDCADDDVEAAHLKIAFDVLKHTKRISFWVTLWSVLSIIGAVVALIIMLS